MDTSNSMPKHIINNSLGITVFPDTYWVQTTSGWFLCHSQDPDRSPQILAVLAHHRGGAGEYVYVVLDQAGLFMRHEKTIGFWLYFIVEPDEPRLIINRYHSHKVFSNFDLDRTKGVIVKALHNSEHIVVSDSNTLLPKRTFEDSEPEDTRPDLDGLEGDWSLL